MRLLGAVGVASVLLFLLYLAYGVSIILNNCR